jgi:hypothetical protein
MARAWVSGTEASWLETNNPFLLLDILKERHIESPRKFRLAAVGCARRAWDQLTPAHREAIAVAERYADGEATFTAMRIARRGCPRYYRAQIEPRRLDPAYRDARQALSEMAFNLLGVASSAAMLESPYAHGGGMWKKQGKEKWERESLALCRVIRDIFGNPFRPTPAVAPAWLAWNDGCIVKMAEVVYDERAFDRLPILADALEEAGCADGDLLNHCREPGEHVRGCLVVDLLLARG